MRLLLIAFSVFTITTLSAATNVYAQERRAPLNGEGSYFCGLPIDNNMPTYHEDFAHCDFYDRRFAYREKSIEARELIDQRRENYALYMRETRARYKERLEELHASYPSEQ